MQIIRGALFTVGALLISCGGIPTPFQKSPGGVLKAFLLAANEGKYSEAEQMLSEDAKRAYRVEVLLAEGGFKGIIDKATKNGTIISVDIKSEKIRGEGATVAARVSYKDGSSEEDDNYPLIKENGSWKVTVK
jgi:hypothetical protein